MAIGITFVFGLRSCADEIGCADSIEVTGYILDRDEARPTRRLLSTQMIRSTSTIGRNPPTSDAVRLDNSFLGWFPAMVLRLPHRTPLKCPLTRMTINFFPHHAPSH